MMNGWRLLGWLALMVALTLGFVAYLSPTAMVTMANLWALCGF
ncbi:hypothetical protein [Chitinimonas lacunae]|uniref:Uncharacterized protein n=1 Tax=Chitinimonas lacunae TaxID=1963018 RepID=A0ABV8MK49_9NEIS